ncbi:putative nucleotidyltransferase, Ribonuclease H [Helianthus annuus]|nr:putative nucleotidyltransferase, Ribonuclease H [Helianthus annuus]
MTTRNQEVDRIAKDVSRLDEFTAQTQEGLMSLKTAFDNLQAAFAKIEKQGTMMPRNEGDRICNNRLTKIEFPKFNGDDVEGWLYKCDHFFSIDETPERYKVRYAAVHMEGRALQWHQGFMKSSGKQMADVTWDEYSRSAAARFAETLIEDAMGALKALVQTGELDEYCDEFDLLLNKVTLQDEYTISLFIEGLKPEIKCHVKMFKPKTLRETYSLARMQNQANKILGIHTASSSNSGNKYAGNRTNNLTSIAKQPVLATPVNSVPSNAMVPKRVTNKYMDDKRAKGECFYCNEKYVPGHSRVCKGKKQLFLVEVEEYQEDDEGEILEEVEKIQGTPQISLNALMGIPSYSTMQVVGMIGTRYLYILLDSGSTHNFMSRSLAQKLKCTIRQIPHVQVTVADGNKMECVNLCKDFQWIMQGNWFTADMMIIDLDNYDIVLGIQWLETLNDIVWNFKNLTMKFNVAGQDFELKGTKRKNVGLSSMEKITSLIQDQDKVVQAQLFTIQDSASQQCMYQPVVGKEMPNKELEVLLKDYEDIFEIPKGLPPSRPCDHRIVLKDDKINLNLKPYRYHSAQKDVIEQMTQELLDSGVIRHSSSSFAAPVVLVKKKDGSWRMCVDYRRLNEATVKDVFPIPLIEELLDELQGAVVFSKLDLRSGYHQVRMYEPDIYKTAFKTHQGHFEFLVLPFGLTNAPATFQSLMNNTFKSVLRKCALVFFDDILVFSTSWKQHLLDLKVVLDLMRLNSLKAKKSKCSFAGERVEYLGHFLLLSHPYTAATVANVFPDSVFKIHGSPDTIVSDRDPLFLSNFWKEFMKLQGVQLAMSSAYHPQSDGQTEVLNRCLEGYLRSMCMDAPLTWVKWIPLAQWWYNTTWHSAIKMSPYEALFGVKPNLHIPYIPGDTPIAAVEELHRNREAMIQRLKKNLEAARNIMKQLSDNHRIDREFQVGDWVYVKLHPFAQQSLKTHHNRKLSPKYFGPFLVIKKVGKVAYKLDLPPTAQIHHTFHVSLLKKAQGSLIPTADLPQGPRFVLQPRAVLDRQLVKRGNKAAMKVLIHWEGLPMTDASWEFLEDVQARFPDFTF